MIKLNDESLSIWLVPVQYLWDNNGAHACGAKADGGRARRSHVAEVIYKIEKRGEMALQSVVELQPAAVSPCTTLLTVQRWQSDNATMQSKKSFVCHGKVFF
jgi:hypothetical protein